MDFLVLDAESTLAQVLGGEGWTTAFVDDELFDPRSGRDSRVSDAFPFIEVDPVDARLLPRIRGDHLAITGERKAGLGGAAGEAGLIHVVLNDRGDSIVLINDRHAVGLGRRRGAMVGPTNSLLGTL